MSVLIDLTGMRVGRLTVVCRDGTYQRPSGNKEPTWRCVCDCGNEIVVISSNLKKANTLSCGCLQKENRKTPHRKTQYRVEGDIAYITTYDGIEFFVNSCDLDLVLQHRWHTNCSGHVSTEYGIPVHRLLMNSPKNMDVHHINGNKLDNRRINLIMMTRSEHASLHMKMRNAKQPPKGDNMQ